MLLAIETATDRASVALGTSAADAVEREFVGARRHAAELLPAIESLLADTGNTLAQVSGVLASDGPGSFTGLRVGAAVAKALVHARDISLWTAPSLLVRAAGVGRPGETVLAVANALRGELYAAAYRIERAGFAQLLAPRVYRLEELLARDQAIDRLVGEAPPPLARALEEGLGRRLVAAPEGAPHARVLLDLKNRPGGAVRVADAASWEPVYGRPAEAQARWETAHGRPLPDSIGRPG